MDRVAGIRCWIGEMGSANLNETMKTRAGSTWTTDVSGLVRAVLLSPVRVDDRDPGNAQEVGIFRDDRID